VSVCHCSADGPHAINCPLSAGCGAVLTGNYAALAPAPVVAPPFPLVHGSTNVTVASETPGGLTFAEIGRPLIRLIRTMGGTLTEADEAVVGKFAADLVTKGRG